MWITEQLLVLRVKQAHLTYLDRSALSDLYECAKEADHRRLAGVVIEAGCALGGSSIVLARGKERDRPLFVYDIFGMIPPTSEHDDIDAKNRYQTIIDGKSVGIGDDEYYGYQTDLLAKVTQNFNRFKVSPSKNNVAFVKGLYEDTLYPSGDVCLAHLDCDWYDSVKICLNRIEPHLVRGGRMIIDDYDSWSGCRQAVDEFLATHSDSYRTERRARLHLVRC